MKDSTSKGLGLLLAELDKDPAEAIEEYYRLRTAIIRSLERKKWDEKKDADCDFLADETLDRAQKFLEDGKTSEKGIRAVIFGISKIVWKEYKRKNPWIPEPPDPPDPPDISENAEEELIKKSEEKERISCGRSCLSEACRNKEEMQTFLEYFEDIKTFLRLPEKIKIFLGLSRKDDTKSKERRRKMAENLNISYITLKTRMSRLRSKWEDCIRNCIEKHEIL